MLKKIKLFGLQALIIVFIVALLLELIVSMSLSFPEKSLLPINIARNIYTRFDRNTIQVMPECAIYDEYVTYLLKPGECRFKNREFDNKFFVNSQGIRDDEASLNQPKIIMLGDSITMGWGVEQNETFSQLLEESINSKVLNAGISSFGTVREFRLLERLDLSKVEYLIIQYTDNDITENKKYFDEKNIQILSKDKYQDTVRVHSENLSYFPGKFALNTLIQIKSNLQLRSNTDIAHTDINAVTKKKEVEYFLNVLKSSVIDLSRFNIIVFEVTAFRNDSVFEDELRNQLSLAGNPEWLKRIHVVDIDNVLSEDMFYVLDDHPTAAGHRAVANELVKTIQSMNK